MNDYFLFTLLLAYSRARPRQSNKAEEVFLQATAKGVRVNSRIERVLSAADGRARSLNLLATVGYKTDGTQLAPRRLCTLPPSDTQDRSDVGVRDGSENATTCSGDGYRQLDFNTLDRLFCDG